MTPLYQKQKDADHEVDVLSRMASAITSIERPIGYIHYPSATYMIDGCLTNKDGGVHCWVEVKPRGGYALKFMKRNSAIIDVTKYMVLRDLSNMTGVASYLVFKTRDDHLLIHQVQTSGAVNLRIKPDFERKGRGDLNDIDAVIMIPYGMFKGIVPFGGFRSEKSNATVKVGQP